MFSLSFSAGTLEIPGAQAEALAGIDELIFDHRTGMMRARAMDYRRVVIGLREKQLSYHDEARDYKNISVDLASDFSPRPHQTKALASWLAADQRGVAVIPTGGGKTVLAAMAIAAVKRSTLVVVPTIDLLEQWQRALATFINCECGILGGGQKKIEEITVATYDSARIYAEKIGARFGLVVFDECHHLPATHYQFIAEAMIAPFRLGLTATIERADQGEELVYRLVGPLVFEGSVADLVEKSLSPYDVVTVEVELTEAERNAYSEARDLYVQFVKEHNCNFNQPGGWKNFLFQCGRSVAGRTAFKGYLVQKKIAQRAENKLHALWDILVRHSADKIIIFTDDNKLAYDIGVKFFLAVITYQTKDKDRRRYLEAFRSGELSVVVTSRVLNEGVDVPDASVGVVVSGTGAVREHVQRLGRILRNCPGKRAVMYELLATDTSEIYVNRRRKRHNAYQVSY